MDSFELNKIIGAILGTLLFVMGVGFLAESIYHPSATGPGYALPEPEGGGEEGGGGEEAPAVSIGTLLAAADATQGADRWDTLPPTLWAGGDTARAWGSGPDRVFRVRQSQASPVEQYDGASWRTALDRHATDLHGAGPNDVWFATSSAVVHYDGRGFVDLPIPLALSAGPVTGVPSGSGIRQLSPTTTFSVSFVSPDRGLFARQQEPVSFGITMPRGLFHG